MLKSSEKTPLTALLMGKLIHEAGFPPGVVNVLSGYGPDCGSAIAKHPGIDKVAFTGSTAVGHKIVQYSAESNLKRVTLELGGKSPLIVCDDADLEAAADVAHIGLFLNHGQCCCASSRIFVDEKIYDKFAKMCIERAQKIDIGTEEGKFQGPQVDDIQFEKILGFIDSGKKEGAKCMLGGNRCGSKGYYVEPTIFTEVTDEMKIAKEEIFGPVMQLMKVCGSVTLFFIIVGNICLNKPILIFTSFLINSLKQLKKLLSVQMQPTMVWRPVFALKILQEQWVSRSACVQVLSGLTIMTTLMQHFPSVVTKKVDGVETRENTLLRTTWKSRWLVSLSTTISNHPISDILLKVL